MKAALENVIQKTVHDYSKEKGFDLPDSFQVGVVVSKDPTHGDFATNVAMQLAKFAKQKPASIAGDLQTLLQSEDSKAQGSIEKVEIAGPGFLNFYLTKGSIAQILNRVQKEGSAYGSSEHGKNRKVLIEFVSANPTGPLTIAHGRQAAIGDVLARILKKTGHYVDREYYLNDAGRQMNLLGASLWTRYLQALGKDAELPEDGYQGDYLVVMGKNLAAEKGSAIFELGEEKGCDECRLYACEKMMATIKADLDAFGLTFDRYFSERSLYENDEVQKTFKDLEDRKFLYESEGALWFRSTDFGDDKDRVVKKSNGDLTYLAPDIAYHRNKYGRGYNWLINLLGPDHHGYVARLKAACQALGHDVKEIEVLIVQLVSLFRKGEPVRMSTRAGEFVTLRELVDEVGRDAARFFFVMRRVESLLDFDLELAKEKSQDNPVYYLQYAHARICSIIRKSEKSLDQNANADVLVEQAENDLMRKISEFPDILIKAGDGLEPYKLVDYLRDLAATFHKFYAAHRVLTDDEALTSARLLLCDCARIVLRNGLEVLGISAPESM